MVMEKSSLPTDRSGRTIASVADLLRRRAQERPRQLAVVFVPDSRQNAAEAEVAWTYEELDRRAAAIAAALREQTVPGDRAVLVFPPGLDFVAAFFGCLYAGVLPAPATYPKPRRASPRLDAIVEDCTPKLALTTAETVSILALKDQSRAVQGLKWLAVDESYDNTPAPLVPRSRDDAAFLQYTSGSTSQPRGVVVTHGNLLHNLELIRLGFGLPTAEAGGPVQSAVFWLPAYHDMGLIGGILSPLSLGITSYLLAPATFLQRPLSWLETISRTGATISGAPNFAYELCTRKISADERARLDLNRWKLAFCGAEPIDAGTLHEFADTFAPAGFRADAFYPCYGLAEATLMVSGGAGPSRPRVLRANRERLAAHELVDINGTPGALPLVSCGRPLGNQEVVVVDPQTGERRPVGAVGEIWIRGHSVASGYWNHPEELRQTFGGRLADGSGPFLRTGDLGSFVDGELFVTGRLKDVIIIRGRNIYPQDVERTADDAHEAVETGAAFAVGEPGHEELVVVHQVARAHRKDDLAPVIRAIRAAIVEEHEVDPHAIVLLRPMTLPMTSSGKVQRRRCRELFEAGQLEKLADWSRPIEMTTHAAQAGPRRPKFLDRLESYDAPALAAEVQKWMLAWLADHIGAPASEMSPDATFAALGIDSLTAVELNVEFETVLRLRLPPAAAWSYPTPAALSKFLAESLLSGAHASELPENEVDSWFEAMEADARRP
jgi:acyl-CoA synthetase (AMP-forming)/AMP-acid ligase II/acyl carrier protein